MPCALAHTPEKQPDRFILSEEIDDHAVRSNQYAILNKTTTRARMSPAQSTGDQQAIMLPYRQKAFGIQGQLH
jgi:hypothetical protein